MIWLLILIAVGALLGAMYGAGKGGDKNIADYAAEGAMYGGGLFLMLLQIVLPFVVLIFLIRACS